MKKLFFLFGIASFLGPRCYSQSNTWQGVPAIQTYSPEEFGGHFQSWDAVQSKEGILYFGNGNGVLEYDGVNWRLFPMPNESTVRVLEKDENDRIYVGAQGELGYLVETVQGGLSYRSLVPQVDSAYHDFRDVFTILIGKEDIYVGTEKYHFRWPKDEIETAKAELFLAHPKQRTKSFLIDEELYFFQARLGLAKKDGDSLKLVPGGERVALEAVHGLEKTNEGELRLSTYYFGQYTFDGRQVSPIAHSSSKRLATRTHYTSLRLSNGSVGHSVFKNPGLIIADQQDEPILFLNEAKGLVSESIYRLFEDREGALWLTQNNGISKIELQQPVRLFPHITSSLGIVNDIQRHEGKLYLATSGDVFIFENSASFEENPSFVPLPKGPRDNHELLSVKGLDDQLLIASPAQGLFSLNKGKLKNVSVARTISLHQSHTNPYEIFVGTESGLARISWQGNGWGDLESICETAVPIHGIIEAKGELWLKSYTSTVIRVWWEGDTFHHRSFEAEKGLPSDLVFPFSIDNEVVFEVGDSVFYYHADKDSFLIHPTFAQKFGEPKGKVLPISNEQPDGQVWVKVWDKNGYKQRALAKKQDDGSYTWRRIYDEGISGSIGISLLAEGDSLAWMGGAAGLVRLDLRKDWHFPKEIYTLVRKVQWGNDSILYLGGRENGLNRALPFGKKTLRFEYACPSFAQEDKNQFQYKLEGFDTEWSGWTSETYKEYTNLNEGNYRFLVRAKNIYQYMSEVGSYDFQILPPWYRTAWGYLLYALSLALAIWGVFRWRMAHLEAEKLALERLVDERTEELRAQTQKLQALDRFKSRFFANISHEFRTPLSLIKGPLADLQQGQEKGINSGDPKLFRLMNQQADRLLRLVNQLLALSKLESGSLTLDKTPGDIHSFLRSHASAFLSLAEQKGISFYIKIPGESQGARFDQEKLAQVISNLLANAFKFTEDGGKVDITSTIERDDPKPMLYIKVSDTGIGIHEKQIPYIFDRFFQIDEMDVPSSEGTGIGLSLVKELTEFMGGRITVESEWGKGTVFTLRFPLELTDELGDDVQRDVHLVLPRSSQSFSKSEIGTADPGTKGLILIAEDQPDLRNYVREALEIDFRVMEAEDGQQAWEAALSQVPDLVISDWMMPKLDGMQLCKLLKEDERTSHIPVLMLTAKADLDNKLEGLKGGADDYLTKPFNKEELGIRIHNLVAQRKRLQEKYSRQLLLGPKEIVVENGDEVFLNKITEVIEKAIEYPDFGVVQLREELGMSRMQLQRKLKALTDMPPNEFIRFIRLKRAAQLLESGQESVSQIAYQVGFNNLSYFAKCFKEQFGKAPSAYQNTAK